MRAIVTGMTAALMLAACASFDRFSAADDVHAFLSAVRDNDRNAFNARVDKKALSRSVEAQMLKEVRGSSMNRTNQTLAALVIEPVSRAASDALVRPAIFRAIAVSLGYSPDKPIPRATLIAAALKPAGQGRVCATEKLNGPCLLTFENQNGVWKLVGFETGKADLRP